MCITAGYITAQDITAGYITEGYIMAGYITAGYTSAGYMTAGYITAPLKRTQTYLDNPKTTITFDYLVTKLSAHSTAGILFACSKQITYLQQE